MHSIRLLAAGLNVCILAASAQPIISTYAGGPPMNGPALSVPLPAVNDVKADASGNLYICLSSLHVVYKMDTTGNLKVIAGTGVRGFSGDGGPATSARLFSPMGLALDKLGNLYIADYGNIRVRKVVLATGTISTVAGNGDWQYCYTQPCNGDGGPATDAFVAPTALGVDASNNLYIGEDLVVRKITGTTITTVAGNGTWGSAGDGGLATQAAVQPSALAFDSSNIMYIADRNNSVVRMVANGVISTFAGNSQGANPGDGGPATSALLYGPVGLACDTSGNLYIAEYGDGYRVRKVTAGIISTLNYSGSAGGITVDPSGNVLVADDRRNRIWKITGGAPAAVAGSGEYYFNGDNIPATSAAIAPYNTSMALDAEGNLYFADEFNSRIRKISRNGIITTVAGTGAFGFSGDNGPATSAELWIPMSTAIDGGGRIYIGDAGNGRVRAIDKSGIISTLATDAVSTLAVDNAGSVYYATTFGIRKIANGIVTTVLGGGPPIQSVKCETGPAASFAFSVYYDAILSLAVDPKGILYFATQSCIRRLNNGVVERVAGGEGYGPQGYGGDGGPATSALFSYPSGIAFDAAGRLYVADKGNNRIRRISNGIVTTLAGNGVNPANGFTGTGTFSGDGGPATNASLNQPAAVLADSEGNLFIADSGNFRIRKVSNLNVPLTRDFDGTGRSSALLYDPNNGQEYTALSNGDGSYTYVPNPFTSGFDILRTGDFNGDGKTDLVVYNSHTSLAYIGMSNGDGTFAFQSLFWSPGYDVVEAGDLNGDGKSDFALYNSSTGTMYTGISNGTGAFTYKYTLVSSAYTFVRLADFDGDGKADIFLYNATSGIAYLGIGDGTGGFTFHPLSISAGYNLADIGDLNGDGKADIILYNSTNGNTATGISDGVGGFTFSPLLFSSGFTSVRLADYTGDGKADVTVYNKNTAAAYFGTGNGAGNFTFQSLFWSPAYDVIEPEDVSGDGKADIILYNSSTGTEYTGVSNGNGTFTYTYSLWGPNKKLAR